MIVTLRKECHSKNDGEYAMQDDKSVPNNDEHVISPSARIQNILEYLADLWKSSHIPSNEDLKRIAEFVVLLPEAYKSTALTTLAEHFVNSIGLHILDLMATYQQKAEQEGISAEDVQRTFEDIFPGAFSILETLRKQLSVQSLDALAALSNITIPLYTLSKVDSADPHLLTRKSVIDTWSACASCVAGISPMASLNRRAKTFLRHMAVNLRKYWQNLPF